MVVLTVYYLLGYLAYVTGYYATVANPRKMSMPMYVNSELFIKRKCIIEIII